MSTNSFRNCLGIEFGSTRIKSVLIDNEFNPVASGDYTWKSSYTNKIWTYSLDEVWKGLKASLSSLDLSGVDAVGISAMMHGYLAFDKDWNLLVPFRTWQNTITGKASAELTELFNFNIPQRWSIAHLYQAVLNNEDHIPQLAHITTHSAATLHTCHRQRHNLNNNNNEHISRLLLSNHPTDGSTRAPHLRLRQSRNLAG